MRGGMCTAGEGRKVGRSMDLIRRKNPWKRVRNLGTRGQIDVLTFTYLRYRYLLPVFCDYFIVRSVKLRQLDWIKRKRFIIP